MEYDQRKETKKLSRTEIFVIYLYVNISVQHGMEADDHRANLPSYRGCLVSCKRQILPTFH